MLSALPVAAQLAPVLFYSDLDSGPATGGEGGADGAFLCVYGENFGQPRGSASLKIGGVEVSTYKVWSDPGSGYLPGHYAKACGQISHATPAGQQNVVLSTGAGVSNAVPFTVRAGNIYFASPAGSDDNPGTNLRPFATLRRCKNALAGGDICYVHSMTITSLDNYGAVLWLGAGGSQGKPLAIVAYPGENVALDGRGSTSTSSGIVNYSPSGYVSYFTLAGLTVNGYSFAFNGKPGSYVRLVDNDIECTGPGCSGAAAGFVADGNGEQSFDHATLLGNRFHDIGCNDPNDTAHYENYLAALHPCAWSNSGAIMAYSSGTTLYLSGTPSGWSAPDVLQITYAGSTDIVRPVKSFDQPYCTEQANYTFDCATRAAPGWQLTLDHVLTADIPAGSAVPFQYRIYAPAKSEHSVYFGAYTYFLNFGWNEIDGGGGQACRGLQIFHDASPQNNHDLLIHDNYIHDTTCDAINLNAFDATCGPVQVFNNLIVKAGKGISDIIADPPGGGGNNAAIYMSGSGTPGAASGAACSAQPDELQVFNNTIVNSGITGARATLQWPSARGAITRGYDFYDASTQLILANNILIQPAGTGSPYYAAYQSTTANTIADANLCHGVGACPASFADSTTADPKFVSEAPGYAATDYRLQSTSPAIRQSTQTPVAVADQDGQPQSIPYTIGAYGQASSADSSLSADFTLAATPSGATVGRGQAATFVLTLTPQGQFNGPVTLSCVGLPAFAACTFSPAALTPTNGPTSAVVTIATSQIATGALRGRIRPVEPSYSWLPALGAVATAVSRRRPRKSKVALALLALLLSLTIACGGGQRSVSAPSAPEASAPAWTGDVQVIATAMLSGGPGLSHSTMLTLTVR